MALWFVASIRTIIACARTRDSSDDFKLRDGLALAAVAWRVWSWNERKWILEPVSAIKGRRNLPPCTT